MAVMSDLRCALRWGLAGMCAAGVVLAGAGTAAADPVDPVTPTPVGPLPAPPPVDPAAPPVDPAAPPAPPPPGPPQSRIPPVPNAQYGSGKYGSGILGTLRDLWDQAKDPVLTQDALYGSGEAPAPPPSPQEPAGPAAGRPPLPPGYYPLSGPPPPGYEWGTPTMVPPVP